MEVVDRYGLTLALVEPHEIADEPWRRAGPHIDVVRVPDLPGPSAPTSTSAPTGQPASSAPTRRLLAEQGFLRKPKAVAWVAELGPDEDTYLRRLRRLDRRDIRRAQRQAVAGGLREVVEEPVTPGSLDAFLALYADRVAAMRFGVPFALDHRNAVLHGPDTFYGVFARDEAGELAGGCLVREQPGQDAAVLRFSAVTARWRRSSLARVLYFSAMRHARAKGYRYATLGNEPNLVGHLTQPGLFLFKTNLGFETIPSQWFGDPDGGDEADLVLRLTALNDPTLILGYTGVGGTGIGSRGGTAGSADATGTGTGVQPALACHLYRSGDTVDVHRYTAPFLAPTVVHEVGAGRPETAGTGGPGFTPQEA